ncbi:unnamed protein product [Parajaminaea phylloscopi]
MKPTARGCTSLTYAFSLTLIALIALVAFWPSTGLAQQWPSFAPEGFCPGRTPPPIKRRTCSPFYFLSSCSSIDAATCTVSMNSILDGIRADNATWDCTSTNDVSLKPGHVLCGSGNVPPCTALVSLDSVDVECQAQNFFKRWLQGTGWLALDYHFGQALPQCINNETAWPAY